MTGRTTTERILDAFLAPEADRLADRVIDAALDDVARTPQRRAVRVPWRFPLMPALTRTTAIAAVALVAVVGAGGLLYMNSSAGGGQPTATLKPASPSPIPTAASTPRPVTDGPIGPGVYAAQPIPATEPGLTVTFTLSEPWGWFGAGLLPEAPGPGAPAGFAIQFLDVTSLNPDPCHWQGTNGDVDAGKTVGDLVAALEAQTAYAVSDPVDVTIGGFSGQRVDIVGPTEPFSNAADSGDAPACDGGIVQLWSSREHGEAPIHLQGPANRWQVNILDVDGTRLVVVAQDFPGTKPADRARLDAVLESLVIEP
jgi:hypothetical protein